MIPRMNLDGYRNYRLDVKYGERTARCEHSPPLCRFPYQSTRSLPQKNTATVPGPV